MFVFAVLPGAPFIILTLLQSIVSRVKSQSLERSHKSLYQYVHSGTMIGGTSERRLLDQWPTTPFVLYTGMLPCTFNA